MLKLTIELIPGGFTPLRRTIASVAISNVSDLADCSDYRIEACETANPLTGTAARKACCVVAAHDRTQSVFALVERACRELANTDFVDL